MSYDPSLFWQQKPSFKLCAMECGGKCCKGHMIVKLSRDEVHRLGALNSLAGLRMETKTGHFFMEIPSGKGCVFLAKDNSCSIHGVKPNACKTFPTKPFEFCVVWEG